MKKDLREERKGLLLAFLSLALISSLAVLPTQFRSTANTDQTRTDDHVSGLENYDVRDDKSVEAVSARAEFRARLGRSEQFAAQFQDEIESNEKALLRRFPNLEIKFNEQLNNVAIISPKVGLKRAAKLTAPTSSKRVDVLRSFVKAHDGLLAVNDPQIDDLKVTADYTNPDGDLSFVHLEQEINGVPVFQGELKAAFTKRGEIVRVVNNLAPALDYNSLSADFGASEAAVRAAFTKVSRSMYEDEGTRNEAASTERKAVFGNGDWATTAEKMYFPIEGGVARPAWRVIIWETGAAYAVIVDAETGKMLWRKNLFDNQTQPSFYNVYSNTTSLIKSLDSPAPLSPGPENPNLNRQGLAATRTNLELIGNEPPFTFNHKGWITDGTNALDGNNVQAGLDRESPDGIDAPVTGLPNRIFSTASPAWNPPPGNPSPYDDPLSFQAQRGAVIQMFYVANRFHDEMYRLGFTEEARNFQNENFTGLGAGGDRISAEGQDSSNVNNAQFCGSCPDGTRPKMQMFLWNGPNPDYDGTADAEIIIHELTHGVSGRLHFNGTGLTSSMSGGMGEGWSDFYALTMLAEASDPLNGVYTVGGYATYLRQVGYTSNYYYGIRRFPKAIISSTGGPGNRPHNALTFKDLNSNCNDVINTSSAYPRGILPGNQCDSLHNAGEIWSNALWEVRAKFIQQYGFDLGTRLVLQHVTNGMKLSNSNPTMLDARNAILSAASAATTSPNPDLDVSLIWQGFAARGMGFSASIQSAGFPALVTEAFDLPNATITTNFSISDAAPGGDGDGFPEPGETLVLTVPLVNVTGSLMSNVNISLNGGASVSYGELANATPVVRTLTYTVPSNAVCGSNIVLSFNITSSLGSRTESRTIKLGAPVVGFSQNFDSVPIPGLPTGWTQVASGGNSGWRTVTNSFDSAPNSVFTPDPSAGGGADLISPVIALNSNNAVLNFRHNFDTERGWDGGLLEISISGGEFRDIITAGGSFITGGYNGSLNGNGNPIAGSNGWTGNSGGYITTSVQLPAAANGVAVQLKWRMGHDNNTSKTGWNIDNVSIIFNYNCNTPPPPPPDGTTRADFDGDGKTDRAVFRNGNWFQLRSQNNQVVTQNWGLSSDTPVSGDFDGDRKADVAVFRSGAWYVLQSSTNTIYAVNWGTGTDVPVPADYTGDGKDDVAIFRNGLWAVFPTGGGAPIYQSWGLAGDKPVVGRYDPDTKSDFAVFRNGNWFILNSSNNALQSVTWGSPSDILVPGDYNGDGVDETAVFRSGVWYIRSLTGEINTISWGLSGDIPVPGDYDGDRRLDAAVFRGGIWYVLGTSSGFNGTNWGLSGDTPVPFTFTK